MNGFDVFASLPEGVRQKLIRKPIPAWIEPMLATLSNQRVFPQEKWVFEPKLDGVRCLSFYDGKTLRLMSRNQKLMNNTYPELAEALSRQTAQSFIIDGEIVAFRDGVSSFQQLQQRLGLKNRQDALNSGIEVFYYLFDVLYLDGCDVTRLDTLSRKLLLRDAIHYVDPIRYSEHQMGDAESMLAEACSGGLEGLIAKRSMAKYVMGRSDAWLKLKCIRRQEMVIGGYTDPKGTRLGLGALLVGYYEGNQLRYAGKVGTGFNKDMLMDLLTRLQQIEAKKSPFSEESERGDDVHWVKPTMIAEIGFSEWTADGRLRHPRFEGLRDDKNPRDVVREVAQ
jgi:bifunctional non-homologous end joining protein LigD